MAIRFVNVEPEQGAKPPLMRRACAVEAAPGPAPTLEPVEETPSTEANAPADGEAPSLDLPYAKPEPKPRGRKKALSSARTEKPEAPDVPLLEGLLPELQAHAKPTPKPRGRKKAFG